MTKYTGSLAKNCPAVDLFRSAFHPPGFICSRGSRTSNSSRRRASSSSSMWRGKWLARISWVFSRADIFFRVERGQDDADGGLGLSGHGLFWIVNAGLRFANPPVHVHPLLHAFCLSSRAPGRVIQSQLPASVFLSPSRLHTQPLRFCQKSLYRFFPNHPTFLSC